MVRKIRQDPVAHNEETLFSLQFSIVLVEHLRLISRALHNWQQLTLNEYCTITVLDTVKKPISCTTLSQYLILKHGTMLAILADLEEKSIIVKQADNTDGRAMLVMLTKEGKELARALSEQVFALMRQTFWHSIPLNEVFAPLEECRAQLEQLRGYPMSPISLAKPSRHFIQAMVFRVVNIVVERWTKAVKDYCGLSLNESRVLILLELYGSLSPGEITRKLYIAPSNVALLCSRLRESGLLVCAENHEDARCKTLRCTARGLRLSRELLSVLRKTTCDCYSSYSDSSIVILNAQHMRMYCELDQVKILEETIQW